MILSTANSHARSANIPLKSVDTIETAIVGIKQSGVKLFLVDLQMPGLDVQSLVDQMRDIECLPRIVVFAQHVNLDALEQANDLFEEVMTRGQFNKSLASLVSSATAS